MKWIIRNFTDESKKNYKDENERQLLMLTILSFNN